MKNKLSYAFGVGIGEQILQLNIEDFSCDDFCKAVKDVIKGKQELTSKEADELLMAHIKKTSDDYIAKVKKESEEYLNENATKEGVTVTDTGLQIETITEGTGNSPEANSNVSCHYVGRLVNGFEFDNSYLRGEPIQFALDRVIAGWTEGLQLMKEGGKYRLTIPHELGYGDRGAGKVIPPYSTLIFEIELIKVG